MTAERMSDIPVSSVHFTAFGGAEFFRIKRRRKHAEFICFLKKKNASYE